MLKQEVRKLILDRAPTKYAKGTVSLLQRIIETTFVPDWRKSAVEECWSRAMTISKWAFQANLEWHTTQRALRSLLTDGVIKEDPNVEGSYAVVPTALQLLGSKFRNTAVERLERKILKAVRMRLDRKEADSIANKLAAQRAAQSLKVHVAHLSTVPTVNTLIESYRAEKMPKRIDTRRAYEVWLSDHITTKWEHVCC